jgi:GT2 family glycosyltransferase/glycosyltransferase involved in cell wall biosynthesis
MSASASPQPNIVCLLGMHRSGTSLFARVINLLGVSLGPKERLMKPLLENPKGFWEHMALTGLNEEILAKLGGSWHEPPSFPTGWEGSPEFADLRRRARALVECDFNAAESWGWKDPRNCMTLPFWRRLLPPLRCIICMRSPIDVARSLQQRNDFSTEKAARLWLQHTKTALENTATHPRLLVFYEDMLSDWYGELQRLATFLGQPELADRSDIQSAVREFIDQDLRHHRTSLVDSIDDADLSFPAKSLYVLLRASARLPQGAPATLEDRADRVQDALDAFSARSLEAHEGVELLRKRLGEVEAHLQAELNRSAKQSEERERALKSVQGLQAEQQRLGKALTDKESALKALQVQLTVREKNLLAVQAQATAQHSELAEKLSEKEQAVRVLENRSTEQERALEALREQLQSDQQSTSKKMEALHLLAAEKQRTIEALDARLGERDRALEALRAQEEHSAREIAESKTALKELRTRAAEQAQQLDALRGDRAATEGRLANLQAEADRKEEVVQKLQAMLAEREQSFSAARTQAASERQRLLEELAAEHKRMPPPPPEIAGCTIVAKGGLAHARVLATEFLDHHPGASFFVLLADRVDAYFKPGAERFRLVKLDELDIPPNSQLQFRYPGAELRTALKPFLLKHLLTRHGIKKLVYFDPDAIILDKLAALFGPLDQNSIVLTPYLASSMEEDGAFADMKILEAGTHTTGFLALADTPTTHQLLDWWQKRIAEKGLPESRPGVSADQRWIDTFPGFFEGVHILREPGYGVGCWNLHSRRVELSDGKVRVNGKPGCLFSYAGLEGDDLLLGSSLDALGDARYLFQKHRELLLAEGYESIRTWPYAYDSFDNGVKIPDFARRMHQRLGREARRFGNPFHSSLPNGFLAWLNGSVDGEQDPSRTITRVWQEVYLQRPDLQEAFPDLFGADRAGFIDWVAWHGIQETGLDARFLVDGTPVYRPAQPQAEPAAPAPRELTSLGVNIAGYIASEKGVGEGVRSDIRTMQAAGIPYVLNNFADPGSSNQDITFEHFSFGNPYPTNLMHINADAMPEFARRKGKAYFANHYNIGYWAWELSEFPKEWHASFQYLDEIWVPSNFTLESVSRAAPIPVVRVPHCLTEELPTLAVDRSHFGLPREPFIFLFIFDFHSYMERKNPAAVIDAFKKAFHKNDDVLLVFKCSRPEFNPAGFRAIRERAQGIPFQVIDQVLGREEINTLIRLSDCYVSLHRSEGFGLTIAEAMNLEKPVVATAYSGNMDFMTAGNSFPVKYRLVELDQDHGPYKKGNLWAQPDVDHAAQQMRFIYDNRDAAREIGRKARQDVLRQLSPKAVGELVKERLAAVSRRGHLDVQPIVANIPAPAVTPPSATPKDRSAGYLQLISRIRAAVSSIVPPKATVVVVSRGDEELLKHEGRDGWHFPRTIDGTYAGYYPADSAAAIAHVEGVRAQGADFLLFPATGLWWLDFYADLRHYLEQNHEVVHRDDACMIYRLRPAAAHPSLETPVVSPTESATAAPETTTVRPKCSIIIPVYNKAPLTRQCLDTLLRLPAAVPTEIIVVDDASTDSTREVLAGYGQPVRSLRHETNCGFAKTCNDGAAAAVGEFLVFLNNDTIPTQGWLDALLSYAQSHPQAGAVGSKLLFPNDTIQHAGVVICQDRLPRHIYTGFPADHPAVNVSRAYAAVTGACLLIRRKLFDEMGGFDTAFVNSCEDIDLCLRLRDRGYEAHYCKDSVLYHLESVSRQGRTKEEQQNNQIYKGRWAGRIPPDDLRYYLEDGLLRLGYTPLYPLPFQISPLLAVVKEPEGDGSANQLLASRSQQVLDLLKENIRLNIRVQEAEMLGAAEGNGVAPTTANPVDSFRPSAANGRAELAGGSGSADGLISRAAKEGPAPSRDAGQETLLQAHRLILREDPEIQSAKCALQATMAAVHPQDAAEPLSDAGTGKYIRYQQLIREIRDVVHTVLPLDAKIIVVSKGDEELLKLGGGQAWHFPQTVGGIYAGHYPPDSAAAITHLQDVQRGGAEYLLFPCTAFWWLDHYQEFRRYLDARYRRCWIDERCIIYQLSTPPKAKESVFRWPLWALRSLGAPFRRPPIKAPADQTGR